MPKSHEFMTKLHVAKTKEEYHNIGWQMVSAMKAMEQRLAEVEPIYTAVENMIDKKLSARDS